MNATRKQKIKKSLLNAIKEILLIVVGILLALYINNRNTNKQYKSQIDNNIKRVYAELEKNIAKTRDVFDLLQYKDSLIYLVMNDSVNANDYYGNIDLAYMIMQNHDLDIEDKAYQNLAQLNISDSNYNDEIINNLKELYSLNKGIESLNQKMSTFVFEKSIPLLANNIDSFGDLTYKRNIKQDALNYFMKSKEYKSYVSQYAILAIRNQLGNNQKFYKKALEVYNQISEQYDLPNKDAARFNLKTFSIYEGVYISKLVKDTLIIKLENDSIALGRGKTFIPLIPTEKNRFFMDKKGEFISFHQKDKEALDWYMRTNLMSVRAVYKKNR